MSDFSIPAGTRHLAVIVNARNSGAADQDVLIRFNNDSGANYNRQWLVGSGATASAGRTTGGTSISVAAFPFSANLFGGGFVLIPHYANTANHKAVLSIGGAAEVNVITNTGRWANTGAITRIDLLTTADNFVANSIFLLCAVDERFLVEESLLAADGTVTFSNIPQLDGDLVAVGYCRTDRAAASDWIYHEINADTTDANYAFQRLEGDNATTAAASGATRQVIPNDLPGDSATANVFGAFIASYAQHANAIKQPHFLSIGGFHESSGPTSGIGIQSGRRANIAAYTSIKYLPANGTNFLTGSLFSLYFVPKRLIGYEKLTADKATITHTVPAGYEALVETVFARSDGVGTVDLVNRAFNNDVTSANYDRQFLRGNGSTVSAGQSAGDIWSGVDIPSVDAAANVFGGGHILIPAYAETDRHKHTISIGGPADDYVDLVSTRWENTAAITEIDLTPGNGPIFEGD